MLYIGVLSVDYAFLNVKDLYKTINNILLAMRPIDKYDSHKPYALQPMSQQPIDDFLTNFC